MPRETFLGPTRRSSNDHRGELFEQNVFLCPQATSGQPDLTEGHPSAISICKSQHSHLRHHGRQVQENYAVTTPQLKSLVSKAPEDLTLRTIQQDIQILRGSRLSCHVYPAD